MRSLPEANREAKSASSDARSAAGAFGAHRRWHGQRPNPSCGFCRGTRSLRIDPIAAFHARVRVDENGCWIWTGSFNEDTGYGQMTTASRWGKLAHRFAYTRLVGPIPDGLQIDHLCRVRICVNPEHLEPVTAQVNTRRSPLSQASRYAARTHCLHGHEFTPENTTWYRSYKNAKPYRACRACRRAQRSRSRNAGRATR